MTLKSTSVGFVLFGLSLLLFSAETRAQMSGEVRFTKVEQTEVRRSVTLPGSVESRMASVVAAEVRGLAIDVQARRGDRVRKGAPLVRLRPVFFRLQLDAASGRLKEARARLELATTKLLRARELYRDEVISRDALDDAVSEEVAWQGRVDAANAETASFELSLDRCTVKAPFDGVVVAEHVEVGEWVVEGGPVVEMVSVDRLEVVVEAPERYFDLLRSGTEADVKIESVPGLVIVGEVISVIPRADPQARSFPIRVAIPNEDRRIGVGMLAQVALPIGRPFEALVVPKDALIRQAGSDMIFRLGPDETVQPVPVVSGQGVGDWVVVQGDVTAGQRVVTRGNERLRPGQTVSGKLLEYPRP